MTDSLQASRSTRDADRDACLTVLATERLARIVYFEAALPEVELVSYRLVDGEIVFVVPPESGLAAMAEGTVLAAHLDTVDPDTGEGLSVLITGRAHVITDHSRMIGIPLHRVRGHRVAVER